MKSILILIGVISSCIFSGCGIELMGSISADCSPFSQGKEKTKEMKSGEAKGKDSLQVFSSNK
jgi:hypothetical protein